MYVRERLWGEVQTVEDLPDGGVTIAFTATSEPEIMAWILSFCGEAELLEPKELRKEIRRRVEKLAVQHGGIT